MLQPGSYANLPPIDYYGFEAASYSGLKQVETSVRHYTEWKSATHDTDAFRIGRAVHTLVLEGADPFFERFAIRPREFGDYRKKAARQWRDDALAEELTPLTHPEAKVIRDTAAAVVEHPTAAGLLDFCEDRELSIVWRDAEFDVPCKMRLDAVASIDGRFYGVDLKTGAAGGGTPRKFARDAARFGYGLQWLHYDRGFEAVFGQSLDGWIAIMVEKEPPHGVALFRYADDWWFNAIERRREALETYAEWFHGGRSKTAQAYPEGIQVLECPGWAA